MDRNATAGQVATMGMMARIRAQLDPLVLTRTFTVEEMLTYLLSFGAFVTLNAEDYGDDVELLIEAWFHFNRQTRGHE